jgi:hypothetical protein
MKKTSKRQPLSRLNAKRSTAATVSLLHKLLNSPVIGAKRVTRPEMAPLFQERSRAEWCVEQRCGSRVAFGGKNSCFSAYFRRFFAYFRVFLDAKLDFF